jgi:hypothetical protein
LGQSGARFGTLCVVLGSGPRQFGTFRQPLEQLHPAAHGLHLTGEAELQFSICGFQVGKAAVVAPNPLGDPHEKALGLSPTRLASGTLWGSDKGLFLDPFLGVCRPE